MLMTLCQMEVAQMTKKEIQKESHLFKKQEGMLLRLDKNVWPKKYKCATMTQGELQELQSTCNLICKGWVLSVTKTHLMMTRTSWSCPVQDRSFDCGLQLGWFATQQAQGSNLFQGKNCDPINHEMAYLHRRRLEIGYLFIAGFCARAHKLYMTLRMKLCRNQSFFY